ncbi:hypothetical protein P9112_010451 [Eukaryota sp. TZLM1-RC]
MKLLFLLVLITLSFCEEHSVEETVINEYVPPLSAGDYTFFESFTGDNSKWVVSTHPKYGGEWLVELPQEPAGIPNDKGLVLKTPAAHSAIFTNLEQPIVLESDPFVFQYEVRYQKAPISCAGSYVKLLQKVPIDSDFSDKDSYTIMFGPDICGTSRVHFIFRSRNPKTGEMEEHHMTNPPPVRNDGVVSLYTLVVYPDTNNFEIRIDGKKVSSGNLLTDFEPPVNPPKQIPDPNAVKPEDWDEEEFIPDPEAEKPADWDQPEYIPDPEATMPEDWDEEEDGEWAPPMINNPEYKGEWVAPMIKNPNYQGKWEAPLVDNPNYFEVDYPLKGATIGSIGIEVWSMDKDILFDNILISNEDAHAKDVAKHTFQVKHKKETKLRQAEEKKAADEMKKATGSTMVALFHRGFDYLQRKITEIARIVKQNPIVSLVTAFALALSTIILLSRKREVPTPRESQTETEIEESAAESVTEEKEEVGQPLAKSEFQPESDAGIHEATPAVTKPTLVEEVEETKEVVSESANVEEEKVPEQVEKEDDFIEIKPKSSTKKRRGRSTRMAE